MLNMEEVWQKTLDKEFDELMNSPNSSAVKQVVIVFQTLSAQLSASQMLGRTDITPATCIGAAFMLGIMAGRDGWYLEEYKQDLT